MTGPHRGPAVFDEPSLLVPGGEVVAGWDPETYGGVTDATAAETPADRAEPPRTYSSTAVPPSVASTHSVLDIE